MSTLIDVIRKSQLEARKSRDTVKSEVLTTLIGAAEQVSKSPTDEEVKSIVRKFLKSNREFSAVTGLSDEVKTKLKREEDILTFLLPQQLDLGKMEVIVAGLISTGHALPSIMKHFKENFPGQYDGKVLSEIVKRKLE